LSDWDSRKVLAYIEKADPDVVQPYRNVWDDDYESSGLKRWIEDKNLGVCFFSPLKHGLLSGKYDRPPLFKDGDFRTNVDDFQSQDIIDRMKKNADALRDLFPNHPNPIMCGVIDVLLSDSKNSCVLLGQRNTEQVSVASSLGEILPDECVRMIKELYRR
jgi:aryl-alcohol dehydrogenase-like predicted oxidoreductase